MGTNPEETKVTRDLKSVVTAFFLSVVFHFAFTTSRAEAGPTEKLSARATVAISQIRAYCKLARKVTRSIESYSDTVYRILGRKAVMDLLVTTTSYCYILSRAVLVSSLGDLPRDLAATLQNKFGKDWRA